MRRLAGTAALFLLAAALPAVVTGDAPPTLLAAIDDDMQALAGGRFLMGDAEPAFGDADEKPVHAVTLRAFRLARHAVTFAQFDAYIAATGRAAVDDAGWGRGTRPVIHVSWQDAQDYIDWLNERSGRHYRLPSESEWEYAARAGAAGHFPWGDRHVAGRANGAGTGGADRYAHTAPVGSFAPNAWGLYDMVGNVEQWVADCYRDSYRDAPPDGVPVEQTACAQRVRRGGSWGLAPWFLRVDYRNSGDPALRTDAIGFRLASDD